MSINVKDIASAVSSLNPEEQELVLTQVSEMLGYLGQLDPAERARLLCQKREWARGAAVLAGIKQRGFKILGIMGTARVNSNTEQACELVEEIASRQGSTRAVITGGGPAVMEYSNRGAKAGGSISIGLSLLAPKSREMKGNDFLDIELPHHGFPHRLDNFVNYADVILMALGGYGTDLEDAFYRNCMQCMTHATKPMVYLKPSFWRGKLDLIHTQAEMGLISEGDTRNMYIIAEDADMDNAGTLTRRDHELFHVYRNGKTEADRAVNLVNELLA